MSNPAPQKPVMPDPSGPAIAAGQSHPAPGTCPVGGATRHAHHGSADTWPSTLSCDRHLPAALKPQGDD
jgi:hypothetical protein